MVGDSGQEVRQRRASILFIYKTLAFQLRDVVYEWGDQGTQVNQKLWNDTKPGLNTIIGVENGTRCEEPVPAQAARSRDG